MAPSLLALSAGVDLLSVHRRSPGRYPLLLESVAGGNASSRWDLLLMGDGTGLTLAADGVTRDLGQSPRPASFLDALDAEWRAVRIPASGSKLPFRGGWALFLAYELCGQVEPVLHGPSASGPLPVALALRCPAAIAIDRSSGECFAVCERGSERLLATMEQDAARAGDVASLSDWTAPDEIIEDAPERFLHGVRRVHEYLAAGDVFQVNLSRRWQALFARPVDAAALYSRLRDANPAPFAGLLAQEGWAIASSSPERLVSVRGREVETRPIAGTRPRVAGDDDAERIRDLVGNAKERAEHVMLIDLERNDLGRVCVPGSVRVDELMSVESYSHVHHIVSNVRGELREGVSPGQVIAAVFPGGTITGCPKVRCMQIIAELEGEGRGPYTGALGYLNRDGDMDLNILIRSAWISGREVQLRAGAGLVFDSVAESELEETRAKARGLLRALGAG